MRSQIRSNCYENALPNMTQAKSPRSRLKTEMREFCEWHVFAEMAKARAIS